MVKAGGRSKGGKGRGPGAGPGPTPASPTRRLKKGGKRGRRLCHMDGCTLCPSFGFEGDVAVSCSHHKEEGMRNLTARRCQHQGCFTVANFGMPGDKPGFCAAHSTEGMVNRNKPRGAEGMLAGVTVARSSRRAAKASTAHLDPTEMTAMASSRSRPASGGKDLLMRAVAARGASDEKLSDGNAGAGRAIVGTRARSTGRPRVLVSCREGSDSDEAGYYSGVGVGGGAHGGAGPGKGAAGDVRGVKGKERLLSSAAAPKATFVARRQDPETVEAGSSAKRGDGMKGISGAVWGRSRGYGKDLSASAVMAGVLHRPTAVCEPFLSAYRCNIGDSHRKYADGGRVRVGMDLGSPLDYRGGVRMEGSFMTDTSILDDGAVDVPLGLDIGGSLEDILGTTAVSFEAKARVPDSFDDRDSKGLMMPLGSRASHTAMPASSHLSAKSRIGSIESVISGGASPSSGSGVSFELDHLPELNSVDLCGMPSAEGGAGVRKESRQAPARHAVAASPIVSGVACQGLRLGGVPSSSSSHAATVTPPALSSNGTVPALVGPAVTFSNVTTIRPFPTAPAAEALVPAKFSSEDAWWDVLEGEEYVAMPEPIWGVALDVPTMETEPARVEEDRLGHRFGAGVGRATINGTVASSSGEDDDFPACNGRGKDERCGAADHVAKNQSLLSSATDLASVLAMADEDGFVGEGGRGNADDVGSDAFSSLSGGSGGEGSAGVCGGGVHLSPIRATHGLAVDGKPDNRSA